MADTTISESAYNEITALLQSFMQDKSKVVPVQQRVGQILLAEGAAQVRKLNVKEVVPHKDNRDKQILTASGVEVRASRLKTVGYSKAVFEEVPGASGTTRRPGIWRTLRSITSRRTSVSRRTADKTLSRALWGHLTRTTSTRLCWTSARAACRLSQSMVDTRSRCGMKTLSLKTYVRAAPIGA